MAGAGSATCRRQTAGRRRRDSSNDRRQRARMGDRPRPSPARDGPGLPAGRARPGAAAQPPAFDPVPGAVALPDVIPVFPLPDVMLFPNVSRPLHIFEPRYRAMVADALAGDRTDRHGHARTGLRGRLRGAPADLPRSAAPVGSRKWRSCPTGGTSSSCAALVKFRVLDEDRSRPYRLARVEALPELVDDAELTALGELRGALEDDTRRGPERSAGPGRAARRGPGQRHRAVRAHGPAASASACWKRRGRWPAPRRWWSCSEPRADAAALTRWRPLARRGPCGSIRSFVSLVIRGPMAAPCFAAPAP